MEKFINLESSLTKQTDNKDHDQHYDIDGITISAENNAELSNQASISLYNTLQALPSKEINIGIDEASRKKITEGLSRLLADTYTLYLRTQNFHWNITGPRFFDLHQLFMIQYTELALALDGIAERIRMLGFQTVATFSSFIKLSSIKDENSTPSPSHMISLLCEGQNAIIKTIRDILPTIEICNDLSTQDLLAQRISVHEKNAWMLRSLLN